jgi:hypothetical protein
MDKQIRYLPDETGKNQDNLVRREPHHLPIAVRGRVIVPDHGSFFGESVVIRDRLSGRELTPKRDFTCAGLRVAHTRIAEGPIYAFILVTDDKCSTDIEIDYQVYGGDHFQFVEPTMDLLEESFETNERIPIAKLLKLPKDWTPTFHYHDLGNIDKFDFMLFNLDKIRYAVMSNNPAVFKYLLDFEKMIIRLSDLASNQFEALLFLKMKEFAENFGKRIFGLEKVNNYPLMVENDGNKIASQQMHPQVIEAKEGYLNLGILAEYSKQLFQIYVDTDATGLGSAREHNYIASTAELEALPIGAIFTINDYNFAAIAGNPEIETFYPDRLDRANGYVIRKITSDKSGFGSLFMYTGRANARTYIMRLSPTADGKKSTFRYIANSLDQPGYLNDIIEHIEDRKNPHMDDKRDVDLAQVENLAVATMENLICNMPLRKYLTVENILHYMKRFKTGKKDTSDIFSNLSERSIRKQMQTIYSPCGAWDDNMDIDKIELCRIIEVPTTLPPPEPIWSVAPHRTLVTITLQDDEETTTTTTTTTGEPSGGDVFKVEHYGDFINGDGKFMFAVVTNVIEDGVDIFLQLDIRKYNGDSDTYDLGAVVYNKFQPLIIDPPHTGNGGSRFEFVDPHYEVKLLIRDENGNFLGEGDWVRIYNLRPNSIFEMCSIQVIGKNDTELCSTTIMKDYYDPKYDGKADAHMQWLGYGKSDQLLEFAAWKHILNNGPEPGKVDIIRPDYLATRGPDNYKLSHLDPDTNRPRPMIVESFGWFRTDQGVAVPGAPWAESKQFENFDIKIRYMFYQNGAQDPETVEFYYYRTKEGNNDFGLPANLGAQTQGGFLSRLTVKDDQEIIIETGNQLTTPPGKWINEIWKDL